MPLKPTAGLAIRTPRDDARRLERLALAEQWALVDSHIAEALGDTISPTSSSPST